MSAEGRPQWPNLVGGEVMIAPAAGELLQRQVHPEWIEADGSVAWESFHPGTHDEKQLSVTQGSKVSAKDAALNHLAIPLKTGGTWGVTVADCDDAGLRAIDDSLLSDVLGHAYVDMRIVSKKGRKIAAKALALRASERRCGVDPLLLTP